MANHLRRQIRDYVAGSIVDSLTTTGARVQQTPVYPLATESLPGLAIFVDSEDIEVATLHPTNRELHRSMILVIEGVVLMASTILNSLDLIAKEVEEAMAGNRSINSLARDSYLESTDFRFEPEAHIPVGIVRLNYFVQYANLETASDAVA